MCVCICVEAWHYDRAAPLQEVNTIRFSVFPTVVINAMTPCSDRRHPGFAGCAGGGMHEPPAQRARSSHAAPRSVAHALQSPCIRYAYVWPALALGRLEHQVYVNAPTFEDRLHIIAQLCKRTPVDADVSLEQLAATTEGQTCAALAAMFRSVMHAWVRHAGPWC